MMLDRCGIIRHTPQRDIAGIERIAPVNHSLNGSWRLADVEISQITVNRMPDSLIGENVKIEKDKDLLLSFFPDSSFTEVWENGEYIVGKWKYMKADTSISMIYPDEIKNYKLLFNRGKNGLREVTLESSTGKNLALAGFGKSMDWVESLPDRQSHQHQ